MGACLGGQLLFFCITLYNIQVCFKTNIPLQQPWFKLFDELKWTLPLKDILCSVSFELQTISYKQRSICFVIMFLWYPLLFYSSNSNFRIRKWVLFYYIVSSLISCGFPVPLTFSSLAFKAQQSTIDCSTFRNVVCLQGHLKMPHCLFGSKDTERCGCPTA